MSKIWDALKKAELERAPLLQAEPGDGTRALTPRQRAAVQALLHCPGRAEAAAACGVNERTLSRWEKLPAFAAAYQAAARARLGEALAQLTAASGEATDVLRRTLGDGPPELRVRAAAAILDAASTLELAAAIRAAGRASRKA